MVGWFNYWMRGERDNLIQNHILLLEGREEKICRTHIKIGGGKFEVPVKSKSRGLNCLFLIGKYKNIVIIGIFKRLLNSSIFNLPF